MPTKKPKSSNTHKSIDIKPRTPSSTSRPIIVSNGPLMRDPMLNAADGSGTKPNDAPLDNLSKSSKKIMPLSEDGDSSASHNDGAAPTAGELVEKLKSRKHDDNQNEASSDEVNMDEIANEPAPEPAEPAPDTQTDNEPATDSIQEESEETDKSTDGSDDTDDSDEDDKPAPAADSDADIEAAARRAQQFDELVESEKYFVPINAVKRHHDRQWLAVLIIIVLVLVALDLLFDAGVLKINGFNPPTNFFSH